MGVVLLAGGVALLAGVGVILLALATGCLSFGAVLWGGCGFGALFFFLACEPALCCCSAASFAESNAAFKAARDSTEIPENDEGLFSTSDILVFTASSFYVN